MLLMYTISSIVSVPSVVLNREFRVMTSSSENTRGRLLGYTGLVALVGESRAIRMLYKSLLSPKDKTSFSVNHIRVTFYNK